MKRTLNDNTNLISLVHFSSPLNASQLVVFSSGLQVLPQNLLPYVALMKSVSYVVM